MRELTDSRSEVCTNSEIKTIVEKAYSKKNCTHHPYEANRLNSFHFCQQQLLSAFPTQLSLERCTGKGNSTPQSQQITSLS